MILNWNTDEKIIIVEDGKEKKMQLFKIWIFNLVIIL